MFEDFSNTIGSPGPDSKAILAGVRKNYCSYFEQHNPDEAQLTFLGSSPMKLLRFGPDRDGVVSYATLGCSAEPMHDGSALVVDPTSGPRAELVLPIKGGLDSVIRSLAMLAAAPSVEGLVFAPDALIDFAQPLWEHTSFTGFVLTESEIGEVAVDGVVVKLFQPIPATPNEMALARAKGTPQLRRLWSEQGADFTDPHRASVV